MVSQWMIPIMFALGALIGWVSHMINVRVSGPQCSICQFGPGMDCRHFSAR
jgi:hypothetical protein